MALTWMIPVWWLVIYLGEFHHPIVFQRFPRFQKPPLRPSPLDNYTNHRPSWGLATDLKMRLKKSWSKWFSMGCCVFPLTFGGDGHTNRSTKLRWGEHLLCSILFFGVIHCETTSLFFFEACLVCWVGFGPRSRCWTIWGFETLLDKKNTQKSIPFVVPNGCQPIQRSMGT